jgi:lantibiotic modifying enzyme
VLALHRAAPSAAVLARAATCGRHLVRAGVMDRDGSDGRTPLLTGFAHGAAGIALALLRLHQATGDAAFRDAAATALRYERSLFLPERGNWAGLPGHASEPPCQWCHGAVGIGLARLGCRELIDDAEIAAEIETAITTTCDAAMSPLDHLCCGNFGRLDFLLTAGLQLDRSPLVGFARERAAKRANRAVSEGGFVWRIGDDRLNPGLFQGIAGIGYQLLRFQDPASLPSILIWD